LKSYETTGVKADIYLMNGISNCLHNCDKILTIHLSIIAVTLWTPRCHFYDWWSNCDATMMLWKIVSVFI